MRKVFGGVVCLAVLAGVPPLAFAAAGSLDKTFNGTGLVATDVPGSFDQAAHVAIDSAGRLIVAGTVRSADPAKEDFAVVRYLPNGTVDTTFGGSGTGMVITDLGDWDNASAVAIDSQGRIVVAGTQFTDFAASSIMVVARYTPDGVLDTTFHGGWTPVFHDVAGDNDTIGNAVAIDDQNRIVVAGSVENGNQDFFVVRLNSDGHLDTSFGRNAIGFGGNDGAWAVALDAQGRIVVVGASFDSDTDILPVLRIAIARLNGDGSMDNTFDGDGKLETSVEGKDTAATGLAFDAIGRIVVVGSRVIEEFSSTSFTRGMVVVRLYDDGSLDQSFGSGGKVTLTTSSFPQDVAVDVAIDQAGRIVVGGATGGGETLAVLRLTDQGVLDTTFQGPGARPGWGIISDRKWVRDLLLDGQGRIVTVGGETRFEVTRFYNDPLADLRITKSVGSSARVPGDPVTYTLTLSNLGPDDATDIRVTDILPDSVTFISCVATGSGACSGFGNDRAILYSALASAGTATITLAATLNQGVADGTSVTNTATISAFSPTDPNAANNSASASFTVNNRSDLLVVQSAAKLSQKQLAYTIKVKNNGPYAARQVLLNDPMPTETTFVSVSNGAWTCTPLPVGFAGTLSCTLPNLEAVGGFTEATLIFNVKSTAPAGASIANTVTVTAATYDPNLANNTSTLIMRMSGNGK